MAFKRTLRLMAESIDSDWFLEEFTQFLQEKHTGYSNPCCLKHFAALHPRMPMIYHPTLLPLG